MKKINNIYVLLASIVILVSTKANAQISKAEIRATGLTCSMCSNAINKQLKSLPEVVNVETDLNTNTFTVTLKGGNTLSPKVFKDKVEKAGFFVGTLVVTAEPGTTAGANYIKINTNDSKTSEIKFQVLDKGFVTDKEFKKLSKTYKNTATYAADNQDDFHIKYLN